MKTIIGDKAKLTESGDSLASMWGFGKEPLKAEQDKPEAEQVEPDAEESDIEALESEAESESDIEQESDEDNAESELDELDEQEEPKKAPLSKEAYGQLVPVTINGKTEMIPVQEAINGYQRTKDYTRKTEELANQRRAVENTLTELHTIVEQSLSQKAAAVNYLREELPTQEDLYKLAQEDPDQYIAQKAKADRINAKLAQIQQEAQREMAEYEKQQRKHVETLKQQNLSVLKQEMPHLMTEEGQRKLINFAKGIGYTEQQIRSIVDARLLITLEEQRQWREHKNSLAQGRKKLKKVSKHIKAAGRTEEKIGESARQRQLKQNVINNKNKKGRAGLGAAAAYFNNRNGLR